MISDLSPAIHLFAGQIWAMPVTFVEEDGTPLNLTGATVHLMVKRQLADPDADAVLDLSQGTHVDATEGKTTLTIDLSGVEAEIFARGASWVGSLWLTISGQRIPYGNLVMEVAPSAKKWEPAP